MNTEELVDINNAYRLVRKHLSEMGHASLEQLHHAIEVELREREGGFWNIFERNYLMEKLKKQ